MCSVLLKRPGLLAWSPRSTEEKGFVLAGDSEIAYETIQNVSSELSNDKHVTTSYRFSSICWTGNVIIGGTNDGAVVFLDASRLIKDSTCHYLSQRRDHTQAVSSVSSSCDEKWVTSAGGQILLWDVNNLVTPYSPGWSGDETKFVRWSRKEPTVFASLASNRASIWDMRRHGKATIEFAELGISCDWSSLSWSPKSAHSILLSNQSPTLSVIQKWDLRYPTGPITEFRHHERGVANVDWNEKDTKLALSADRVGSVILFSVENGEILGRVPCLQDQIKNATWSPAEPSCLAVQYSQCPTQMTWIDGKKNNPKMEALSPQLSDSFIPSWASRPAIGCSLALGQKLVTHWSSFDHCEQRTVHTVEVEHITRTAPKEMDELQNFAQIKKPSRYQQFFADKAAPEPDEMKSLAWQFLSVTVGGAEDLGVLVDALGFSPEKKTNGTATSTSATTSSATSFDIQAVDWAKIDDHGWLILDNWLKQDHEKVVELLMEKRHYLAASVYASQNGSCSGVIDRYLQNENLTPDESLAFMISFGLPDSSRLLNFPLASWKRLLATIMTGSTSETNLKEAARKAGMDWLEKDRDVALLAFILTKDLDMIMTLNDKFTLRERVMQGIALFPHNEKCKAFEKLFYDYIQSLMNRGMYETAWELCKCVNIDNEEMVELRYTLFYVAGGKNCTLDNPPTNPYIQEAEKAMSNGRDRNGKVNTFLPPPPAAPMTNSTPRLAPMPPSSMFYQTPSWDHTTKPRMQLPPQKPISAGWNDPPTLPVKQAMSPPVMQINWSQQQVPMVPNIVPAVAVYQQQDRIQQPVHAPSLTAEDEAIINCLFALLDSVPSTNQATIKKKENVKGRLSAELTTRLANQKLSQNARYIIHQFGEALARRDFHSAHVLVASLAQSGADFVEVSSFLPSLKSLASLVEKSY